MRIVNRNFTSLIKPIKCRTGLLFFSNRICAILFSSISISLVAQQPIVRSLTSRDGLPSNIVYRISQDTLGQLWLATDNGICVYDGRDIENIQIKNLNDHFFPYIQSGPHGGMWMLNISGQLAISSSEGIELAETVKQTNTESINQFFIDKAFLWINIKDISSTGRIECYKIGKSQELSLVRTIAAEDPSLFLTLIADRNKVYLQSQAFGEKTSIALLDPNSEKLNRISFENAYIDAVFLSDHSFIAVPLSGTAVVYNNGIEQGTLELGKKITDLIQLDDDLYVCTTAGFHKLRLEKSQLVLGPSILPNLSINALYKGREGQLWAGTYNNGLVMVNQSGNLVFPLINEGGGKSTASAISKYREGIVAGTNHGAIVTIDNNLLTPLENVHFKVNHIVNRNSNLFLCTSRHLLEYKVGYAPKVLTEGTIKSFDFIDDDVLVLSKNIGSSILNLKAKNHDRKLGSKLSIRSYACKGLTNEVWIGNTNGLYVYELDSKNTQVLDVTYSISDIESGDDNIMYVSTFANGLYIVDQQKNCEKIYMPTERILDLHYANHKLAMATDQGVVVYNTEDSTYHEINKHNWLPSNNVESVFLEEQYLWVGTDEGLCKIDLSKSLDKVDFLTNFCKVEVNGELLANATSYQLENDLKQVKISYQSTAFLSNSELRYEYRLLGLDSTWVETKQKQVSYPNLDSGSYTFEFRSVSNFKRGKIYAIDIAVRKSWYEFRIVQLLLLGLFGWIIYLLSRVSHRRKMAIELDRQKEIKKMEGLQMTALQNHMNPHFVSNALYSIQDLINEKKSWEASEFTSNFAEIVRQAMRYATKERISLAQELAFLNVYLDLEMTRINKSSGIEVLVDTAMEENKSAIFIPPLLVQPIIENAFKHANLRSMEYPRLKVCFSQDDRYVICEITDNGVGYGKNTSPKRKTEGRSTGLETVRERLLLNESQLDVNSEKDVMTVSNNSTDPENCGTTVIIRIAYKRL